MSFEAVFGLPASGPFIHRGAMIAARHIWLVLVTVPDRKTARHLAQSILRARLAACVNLVPGLESHYWWQNKLEHSAEILLLIKSTRQHLVRLEELVLKQHPYDTPEVIAWPLGSGNARYLAWLETSVKPRTSRTGRIKKEPGPCATSVA